MTVCSKVCSKKALPQCAQQQVRGRCLLALDLYMSCITGLIAATTLQSRSNSSGLKAWSLQCILQQCFEVLLPHYQARLLYLLYPCTRLYSAARVQTGIVCSTSCPLNALSWHKAGLLDTRSLQHVQRTHVQEQPRCCRVTLRFRHTYRQNVTRSLQAHRRE